jgi:hypothetical protein
MEALRHSLWIKRFSIQASVGFYEDIHTKQRRAEKYTNPGSGSLRGMANF